jgi:photosystem I P700 chlorophyll a apoprotein A1
MSWSGHQIHISLPINRLLDSGVDPAVIPWPEDLLFRDSLQVIVPSFGSGPLVDFSVPFAACRRLTDDPTAVVSGEPRVGIMPEYEGAMGFSTERLLNPSTAAHHLGVIAAHHLYLALVLIASGLIAYGVWQHAPRGISLNSNHATLSISLLLAGSSSIVFAHHVYAMPVYPYLASDYPTVLSLVYHHLNIGSLLTIGAAAHASIGIIRDLRKNTCSMHDILENQPDKTVYNKARGTTTPLLKEIGCYNSLQQVHICVEVLNHRDIIVAHLIYLSVALGLHSFGLYIHNDTLQSLGRAEDIFADNSIGLKPVFAVAFSALTFRIISFDIEVLDGKVAVLTQELGTADFMVHHIHAFTIHTSLLILLKGVLYARNSRLVSDKLELGFRYPCDGPGRGGTCQISSWDHKKFLNQPLMLVELILKSDVDGWVRR